MDGMSAYPVVEPLCAMVEEVLLCGIVAIA